MPIFDTSKLPAGEPRPGWRDRYFRSESMSFAYYDVDEGSSIHEHAHPEEEVWHVVGGTLHFTLDGEAHVLGREPPRSFRPTFRTRSARSRGHA